MSIGNFFNHTVDTQRQESVGGGSFRQDWNTVLSDVPCAIHPVNGELVNIQGGAFYKQYKIFCAADLDIEIGDRIVDGDDVYTVSGKSDYNDLGGSSNEHMRLNVVKGK